MAITYVGGVTGGRAGSTNTTTQSINGTLTGGSNTAPSAGDLVVVYCSAAADGTANPANQAISGNTSGAYSTATYQQANGTTYDTNSQLNYQFMGSTPDTTLTIPSSGNARNAQRWVVHVFRNVDSGTPLDVAVQPGSGTGTGRPVPVGIAPTTAGAWIVALYASAAGTGTAYTAPTELVDWLGNTQVDTADCMQGGGYYSSWTSGTYTPQAITAGGTTNAADSWTTMTVALRPAAPPNHATSGTLTGPGSTVDGTASSATTRPSSGVLVGPGSVVDGASTRFRAHATSGVLTGPGSTLDGTAARTRVHATTGVLAGAGAVVVGASERSSPVFVTHATSGALAGPGSVVTGSASSATARPSSGVLVGQGSTVTGTSARFRAHATEGVLVGAGSTLAGTAARVGAAVTHETSGALSGSGSTVSGTSARIATHDTSGSLVGQGSVIDGTAQGPSTATQGGGGWVNFPHPRKQTPEEIRQERIKLGIIPPDVAKAVVDAVSEVVESRKIANPEIDLAKAERKAKAALAKLKRQWLSEYIQLLAIEYARIEQENEDAAIAMMLFEM